MATNVEIKDQRRVVIEVDPDIGLEPSDLDLLRRLLSDPGRLTEPVVKVEIHRPWTTDRDLLGRLKKQLDVRIREMGKRPVFTVTP